MIENATLMARVRSHLKAHAHEWGLDAADPSVDPILNWGGFVNRSFRVSDCRTSVFLKLASDSGVKQGLGRWRQQAEVLADSYHAPRMLGWLEIDAGSFCGPVFEWIEGGQAAGLDGALGVEMSRVIQDLHADAELHAWLAHADGGAQTCAHAYLRTYHDRFVEDLAFVEADPPPFVGPDRLDRMRSEVVLLEKKVLRSAPFQEPADRPVHGDLWLNNTLVDSAGRWYLLDWDGLSLGDPVADWAMLFGPSRERPQPATEGVVLSHTILSPAERQRLSVYARASLLDWVIDPLADWVQAGSEPEHGAQVRMANERTHDRAWQLYQSLHGR